MIFSMVSILLPSQRYGILEFKVTGSSINVKAHQYRNTNVEINYNSDITEYFKWIKSNSNNTLKSNIDYQKLFHNAKQMIH